MDHRKPPGRPKGTPKTGGRQKGGLNKATREVRLIAARLVNDRAYRKNLKARLRNGSVQAAIESMLWHYAYGKPKETVAVENPDGSALAFTLLLNAQKPDDAT